MTDATRTKQLDPTLMFADALVDAVVDINQGDPPADVGDWCTASRQDAIRSGPYHIEVTVEVTVRKL